MYIYELSANMQDLITNFCEAKDVEESFLDSFDSIYEVEIATLPFLNGNTAGTLFEFCDPYAYKLALSDYNTSLSEDCHIVDDDLFYDINDIISKKDDIINEIKNGSDFDELTKSEFIALVAEINYLCSEGELK